QWSTALSAVAACLQDSASWTRRGPLWPLAFRTASGHTSPPVQSTVEENPHERAQSRPSINRRAFSDVYPRPGPEPHAHFHTNTHAHCHTGTDAPTHCHTSPPSATVTATPAATTPADTSANPEQMKAQMAKMQTTMNENMAKREAADSAR